MIENSFYFIVGISLILSLFFLVKGNKYSWFFALILLVIGAYLLSDNDIVTFINGTEYHYLQPLYPIIPLIVFLFAIIILFKEIRM